MKIAICDDEFRIRKEVEKALSDYFSDRLINVKLFLFENGHSLLKSTLDFDIAFLDVEMPMLSGVEVGRKLKEKNPNIIIFMITAYSEYLDDAFDLGAYRYLQKPLDIPRLYRSLDTALLSISSKNIKTISINNDSVIIPVNSIVYCETYKRKTKIVTTDGEFISRESLDAWRDKLSEVNFYSPHTSFIVNFNYLKSFNRKSLVLLFNEQNIEISVSPRNQKEFRAKIFLFAERGI